MTRDPPTVTDVSIPATAAPPTTTTDAAESDSQLRLRRLQQQQSLLLLHAAIPIDDFLLTQNTPIDNTMNKDATYTYIHMHPPRTADLFEDFCKDKLPADDIYVPPHLQPINPEDEDDVVPDQHAAFGIAKATQKVREPAWKDLGLAELMHKGPGTTTTTNTAGGGAGGEAGASSSMMGGSSGAVGVQRGGAGSSRPGPVRKLRRGGGPFRGPLPR
ncbi:Apc13p protein-domain-containing protein [Echria macrotheca]|uniref:Apc13p protein-domain-containing protein n=1 Tax=Echria macrotheca TaxID=438768 RepID=A0AAJ0BLD6_9PEZI|nr:Apc13p protein-domain-containing protein [Echria macrotheca]